MMLLQRHVTLLTVQVFVAGAAVMSLELTSSRLLIPFFGNTIFVWGSLIGVVLAGLAAGYSYGGRLADKLASRATFSAIIFTAGLLTVAIPYFSPFILESVLSAGLDERLGPLVSTLAILAVPAILLGMVSPFAVKLRASQLRTLGSVAGNLYSLSTIGSIVGTFLTVFVLIPAADIRTIILGNGFLLMAVSVLSLGRMAKLLFFVLLLFTLTPLGLLAQGVAAASGETVYRKDTFYNSIIVVDNDETRVLLMNGLTHSAMYLDRPTELVFRYTKFFELGPRLSGEAGKVLFVGGGGFSGPKFFLERYPELVIDVAELDGGVVEVAQKFFEVKDDPRLRVFVEDGRRFLQKTEERYDVIVLDAYAKTYVPFHLMTVEFFQLLHDRLTENGVVVSNLIASLTGDTSDIFWAEYNTVSTVFPILYVFRASDRSAGDVQNIILVACRNECNLREALEGDDEVARLASSGLWSEIPHLEEFPILSDNYAPVETLINPVTGAPYSPELELSGASQTVLTPSGKYAVMLFVIVVMSVGWVLKLASGSRGSKHPL